MGCEKPIDKSIDLSDLLGLREHGHVLRGIYLDAFARLERAVMDRIIALKLKASPGTPLCQKLARLAEARASFDDPTKLDEQIKAIELLNDARTDIVHAVLTVTVRYDGTKPKSYWFSFQNACDDNRALRNVTADELKDMTKQAMQSATAIRRLKAATPTARASATVQAA